MGAVNICVLAFCSLMLAQPATPQTNVPSSSAPQWVVGDTWRVGAWHAQVFRPDKRPTMGTYKLKGRLISVTFLVVGIKTVGQTECYEVKVTFPREETGFQRLYFVYYSRAAGKLVRVHDVSLRPDGSTKDNRTDYPTDSSSPTFVDDVPGAVPLDWPVLTQQNVTPQTGGTTKTAQTTIPRSVQSPDGTAEDEVTLTKSSEKKQAKVVQHWRKGEGWWRQAQKYRNGELIGEAILLEVNGRTIADPPSQ